MLAVVCNFVLVWQLKLQSILHYQERDLVVSVKSHPPNHVGGGRAETQDRREEEKDLEAKNCWGKGNNPKVLVKFKAATPGHEDDIFMCGQASNASNFEDVCKKLARYCAVNFKNGGAMIRKVLRSCQLQR